MPLPVVDFRSVVVLVDRFPVLAGVDLAVEQGEVLLLTGGNGTGKSSLLRSIAGLFPIARGDATVLGVDLRSDRRAVRRRVGLLGHQTHLYGDLTVTENVRFAVRASGGSGDHVAPALDELGLSGRLATTAVDRLSAGQRRRTALAVLRARDPELWLLDEPHTGLDAEGRRALDDMIASAAERGRTVMFSSHEIESSSALVGRSVDMSGGTIVQATEGAGVRVS